MLNLGCAVAVMFGSAVAATQIGMNMRDREIDRMVATAYSCGKLTGTREIMIELKLWKNETHLPPWCAPYAENAERHLP